MQIQLAVNYWLPDALVRCVLVTHKVLFVVNNPLLGSLGPQWVLHRGVKASSCVWAKPLWPTFKKGYRRVSCTMCTAGLSFGIRTPLLYPLKTSKSFGLCELHLLVFAVLEIKTKKWIKHIRPMRVVMSSHIHSIASGKLHCTDERMKVKKTNVLILF